MDTAYPTDTSIGLALRALWRHKLKALVFFFAVMGGVLTWNVMGPKKYRSEGKFLLRLGRENSTLDPTVTLGHDQVLSVPPFRDNEINSVVEVLNSLALAEKVVDAVGPSMILSGTQKSAADSPHAALSASGGSANADILSGWKDWLLLSVSTPEPDARQRAIRRMTSSLDAASVPRSNVIRVTYQGSSPQVSQSILAKLMELFLEEHVRLQRPAGSEGFLEAQTARMLADLQQTDEAIRRLKRETEIISADARRTIVVKRVGTLEDESLETAGELAVAEAAVKGLREKLATLPATEVVGETLGIGDEGTNRMRDRFYAVQIAEKEAKAKLDEKHPRMQELLRQEAEAKEILDHQEASRTQITRAPNKAHEQLRLQLLNQEVTLSSLKSKAGVQGEQLAEARRALQRFGDQEAQLARLEREKEIQEARYRKYASVTEEARVDQALQAQRMSNISIVQPASFEPSLVQPRKSLNLAAGFAVGLLGAVGIALLAESRKSRVPVGRASRGVRDLPLSTAPVAHVPPEGRRITIVNAP